MLEGKEGGPEGVEVKRDKDGKIVYVYKNGAN